MAKEKAKSTKTDAMRAQREEQHKRMMAERAERERQEKTAKKQKAEPAWEPPPEEPLRNVKKTKKPPNLMQQPLTDSAFKEACQKVADDHEHLQGKLGNLWEGDPYDLTELVEDAMLADQTPQAFIEEHFAEDIARSQGDDQDLEDSLEAQEADEDED